jgi:phage-related protein
VKTLGSNPTEHATLTKRTNVLVSEDVWAYLLEVYISASETIYLHNIAGASITYSSVAYTPYPFVVGEQTEDGNGNLSSVTVTVDNTTGEVGRWLEINDGASFKKVTLRKYHYTLGIAALTEIFRVSTVAVNEKVAVFTLGHEDLLKLDAPRETFNRRRCPFEYKGPRCKYLGLLAICDKTLRGRDGCEAHDNVANYGGQPGIPQL